MATGDTVGTARDALGALGDIARALKAQHQELKSGALQGPTGPAGPQGPKGDTGATGPSPQWFSGTTWHTPLLVSADAGITLSWDSVTSRIGIGVTTPPPTWYQLGGDVSPSRVSVGRGIDFSYDVGTGTISIETNFDVPSSELYWSTWGTRVTIASGDSTKLVGTLALTDVGRANQQWAFRVEYECMIRRVSMSTIAASVIFSSDVVTANYNSSGVPSLVVTAEGSLRAFLAWDSTGAGVPAFNALAGTASGANVDVYITKTLAGGNDCYAKLRIRKCTEERIDNW